MSVCQSIRPNFKELDLTEIYFLQKSNCRISHLKQLGDIFIFFKLSEKTVIISEINIQHEASVVSIIKYYNKYLLKTGLK